MKILVCIASYGTKNMPYLESILNEYRNLSFDTKIIVLSDQPKYIGKDIEVKVGLPIKNPHSLPFAHKEIFFDKADEFDLFIYTEDDIFISQNNIKTFLELTGILPPDKISGFLRYEVDSYGKNFCPDALTYFSWILNSVEKHGNEYFAKFGNEHSASYMLTKVQLKKAIQSGGFMVEPHEGDYDLECSAATDPYTQCGFQRLLCISRLENIKVHHMPNNYIGYKGITFEELENQIDVLKASFLREAEDFPLFPTRKNVSIRYWDKQYYENPDKDILKALRSPNKRVLSVGAGYGGLEEAVKRLGHHVVAIPIDNPMAVSLQYRGIEVTAPNFDKALKQIENTLFDCVILANTLQHVPFPEALLESLINLTDTMTTIIVKIHNYNFFRWKSYRSDTYSNSLITCLDVETVEEWLKKRGFNVGVKPQGSEKVDCYFKLFRPFLSSQLARSYVLIASR